MRDGKERKVTSKKNGHTCFVDTRRPADSLDTLKQKDDDDEGMPSQHLIYVGGSVWEVWFGRFGLRGSIWEVRF